MAPEKRPAFLFYPADYLNDVHVAAMPPDVRGIYHTLLCYAWMEQGLPTADEELAALAKVSLRTWRRAKRMIAPCFQEEGGRWINPRQERERLRQDEDDRQEQAKHRQLVEQGRRGAAQRWLRRHPTAGSYLYSLAIMGPLAGLLAALMAPLMAPLMAAPMAPLMAPLMVWLNVSL